MPVIGIVACEILELEFAYLLNADPDVVGVSVVEGANSAGFIGAMESVDRIRLRRIPALRGFSPSYDDGLEVLVRVLELGLHNRKRILQEGVAKAVKEMARYVDGIVLGYGLCGNALENPKELLADVGTPIFLPMDEDHPVDDCVGLIIGGRENYYGEQCKEAGTFFMIPGWVRHWKRFFLESGRRDLNPKAVKLMFDAYKRSLIILTPVLTKETMRQNTEEFNKLFGVRTEVRHGTLDILSRTWEGAKDRICRNLRE